MKKIIRILPRGLQKKTVLLVLIMLLAMAAVFFALSVHSSKALTQVVGDTRTEQQAAISQISKDTMHSVLTSTMVSTVSLQARMADNDFADLSGDALKEAIESSIRAKDGNLKGQMASEGTTPRQLTDLIGSLCDLTSGSGDKGTPVVLVQGYFDNYTND